MSNQIEEKRFDPDLSDSKPETIACQARRKMKNSIKNNRRRFSDEQIRLLESIFASETKLEPRKKLQLAGELGLQPRQIAIWFQNRRARWKSKQIEQEYKTLRANYDKLASCFESLKNERQSLLIQLQKLNELLGEPCDEKMICQRLEEWKPVTTSGFVSTDSEAQRMSENGGSTNPKRDESTDGSLASADEWYSFESNGHLDLSGSCSQWFNFWA